MKSWISKCDLAIIPYNYIIDRDLREQINIKIENSIIVFDEGHNIDAYCEELYTFELSINDLFVIY